MLDPESQMVTQVPDPPLEEPLEEPALAIALRSDVLLFGIGCGQPFEEEDGYCESGRYAAALYSLAESGWSVVEFPDTFPPTENGRRTLVGVTESGQAVLLLSRGTGYDQLGTEELWTFDPESMAWNQLPDPGTRIEDACITGNAVVTLALHYVRDDVVYERADDVPVGGAELYVDPMLSVLDLASETADWQPSTEAPLANSIGRAKLACGGGVALLYGAEVDDFASIRVDGESIGDWVVPDPPPIEGAALIDDVWTSQTILLVEPFGGSVVAFDPESQNWTGDIWEIGAVEDDPIWNGSTVVGWPRGQVASVPLEASR